MASYGNPLVGSGWGNTPQNNQQGVLQLPGVPQPGSPGISSPGQNSGQPTSWGNPGGFGNPLGSKEVNRNLGLTNIIAGQEKNYLAPQFAQLMGQYGGQAGDFFKQLMNLGSPYYKQKQQEGFTQGVQQNQNAAAQANQQLNARGYGFGPSGASAAMFGGMQQQGANNLAEQYLQNLFQNEAMQMYGGQGLQGLAGMFNPTQLLGGTSVGANIQDPQSGAQTFNQIAQGISSLMPKPL